ncbi:MAG: hypothetical protein J6C93_03550 [Clostridia bacterium]|nr:hypothetical protein [Clostridia bacterium]
MIVKSENSQILAFLEQLVKLNQTLAKIFKSGDISHLTEMNAVIKEMYRLQHGSEDDAFRLIDEDCKIIYGNFDMLIAVLRTTEDGELDGGAQTALNKLLGNIHDASVSIATVFGLV